MELEFATTEDIIRELKQRGMRFVFIGMEHTNSHRDDMAYIAGQGISPDDIVSLLEMGHEAFIGRDDPEDADDTELDK